MKKLICANCGSEIEDRYFQVLDNFLIYKFFDTEENNIFCSKDCLCQALSVEEIEVQDEVS